MLRLTLIVKKMTVIFRRVMPMMKTLTMKSKRVIDLFFWNSTNEDRIELPYCSIPANMIANPVDMVGDVADAAAGRSTAMMMMSDDDYYGQESLCHCEILSTGRQYPP